MASLNTISVQQLFKLIGTPACPVLIDVRIDEDFHADPCFIPGAYRWPFDRMAELAAELRGKKAIVYCWKGLKLSEGAAALLRLEGIDSEILGGGQVTWREAGYPCVARDKIPVSADGEGSLWVTRHRPKVDRIACPWLIRRFIDPKARFLFVAPAQVEGVADRFGATPFDVEGAFWGHRGAQCTFDTMIEEFGLKTPALETLATVVRAADTNQHDLAVQSAGLAALSIGLSRLFKDDLEQLEAGMTLYDAFYRWARDGQKEVHDWMAETSVGKRGNTQ